MGIFGIMVLRIMESGRIRQDLDAAESRGLRIVGTRYVTRAEWAYEYDSRLIFLFLYNIVYDRELLIIGRELIKEVPREQGVE